MDKYTFLVAFITLGCCLPSALCAEDNTEDEAKGLTLKHCVISLVAEVQIPARKPGVIMNYLVEEGSEVEAGDDLAQIDDAEAKVQLKVAQRQLETAQTEAANDIDVRYAKAAAQLAPAQIPPAHDANARLAGTVPASEARSLVLAENRANLGIEQAEVQFSLAGIETGVAEARVEAANLEIKTRKVTSPIGGIVVRRHHRAGEWVDAGEPICHIVGLDTMRVTGFVNVNEYDQAEVLGRKVTVSVPLANGMTEKFHGNVNFTSPIVQPGGEYRVWANVPNRRIGKFWILRPGIKAHMNIDVVQSEQAGAE